MEGYAAVSNSANRKLTRKRPIRNMDKQIPKLKKGTAPKNRLTLTEKRLIEAKFAKIGQQAKTRFLITESIIYLVFFGLIILAVCHFFL
ncbi:MAG: hypothetical protein AB8G86_20975 [Saprospiraceae bacterium]